MNINQVRSTCCEQCPFARSTPKEYLDTRGYNGDRFVAQASMNALLPCHMDNAQGLADPNGKNRQCAGAAIFRTHINADVSDCLAKLPEDKEKVFANEAELVAHHAGVSVEKAQKHLDDVGMDTLIAIEIHAAMCKGLVEPLPPNVN